MAIPESNKRAIAKYLREKTVQKQVRFYPTDAAMLEYLRTIDNFQGYVKKLIADDMKRH